MPTHWHSFVDAHGVASTSHEQHQCEVVWVRCDEILPSWLPADASIVEKCGRSSSTSVLSVHNVGDEGFGYLEWIVSRYQSLPPCVLLLHGARPHLRVPLDDLRRCLRPAVRLGAEALAVPLSDIFIAGRVLAETDVGRGLDAFYNYLRRSDIYDMHEVRGQPLSLWCCNTWLITAAAIRRRPLHWWTAMRTAAQLPIEGYTPSGKRFATFERNDRNPAGHPEIGVIYEHTFPLMLGFEVNTTREQYEREFQAAFECASVPPRTVVTW